MANYDITEIFQEIEEELMKSMCRNLSRHIDEEQDARANYPQWQTKQLQALERYHQENLKRFSKQFDSINDSLKRYLEMTYNNAKTKTEYDIMKALSDTIAPIGAIGVNQEKLNALINAVTDDFQKAENSILRRSNDLYRQTIFKAQMGLNTGSMTLNQAIDMATKDFLANGINSIRYKNGNLVNIASYSEMALRTAEKRATAYGEGEKRQEWDINTVVVYGHNGACPLCSKWQNRVYIDDVWSKGKPNGKYPLLSEAIRGGLYHPNCKDPTPQTYIEGITEPPILNTKEEIQKNVENYNIEQIQHYNERQIRKYKRLEANSLDENNRKKYAVKVQEWQSKQRDLINAHPEQLKRDYSREKVRILNITEPPKKAAEITPIVQNGLTFYQSSGKIDKNIAFKKINASHSLEQDLKAVNPKYDKENPLFSRNCQRCVCTYEAKRRGFDVVVKPAIKNGVDNLASIDLNKGFPSVFKNPQVIEINGVFGSSVKNNIEKQMKQFGDNSRAIVAVYWKTGSGHVFIVEQVNGKTLFIDPQNGNSDVSNYFKLIKTNPFKPCSYLMRTDNLEFTKKIKDCCEEN